MLCTHTHTHTLWWREQWDTRYPLHGQREAMLWPDREPTTVIVIVVLRGDGSLTTDMRLLIDVRRRVRMQMTKLNIAIMCTRGVFLYYKLCRRSANNTRTYYIHRNTLMYTPVDRLGTSPISGGRLKLRDCRTRMLRISLMFIYIHRYECGYHNIYMYIGTHIEIAYVYIYRGYNNNCWLVHIYVYRCTLRILYIYI